MHNFQIGQRWISLTEHDLGLGMIADFDNRHVTINFPAAGEQRTYAADNAPLNRVRFHIGDLVHSDDQQAITITGIDEMDLLLFYHGIVEKGDEKGQVTLLPESQLDSFIRFTSPLERLLSGQIDKLPAFRLRITTLNHRQLLEQSPVQGLLGARTSLLPHQIYIANDVSHRYAPRVLLADEVGLGKTIEAGMIIHHQLYNGRASRVLIIVPDSLIHQWLVEMLRRFNLHFAVFDQERIDSLDEPSQAFDSEQLILCPLSLLINNTAVADAACNSQWDLLVVDEAHHLEWSEHQPGQAYQCVEKLAAQSLGVLLLTATPEQVGIESHFARLRLLDPDRFYDLNAFTQQEDEYQQLNALVDTLSNTEDVLSDNTLLQQINQYLGEDTLNHILQNHEQPTEEITRQLLDFHGTSRVLFRNTRAAIPHFPIRKATAYALPCPSTYRSIVGKEGLTPEHYCADPDSLLQDPRIDWLKDFLREIYPSKALLICAHTDTAIALEQFLRLKTGIRSAVFHEDLGLIERDRAAAYFADEEEGSQILVCSEIGSEGRNFQFSHHLVLFDLPLNPDLLEQRIGRLDRIGQRETIQIHIPYFEGTPQEVLFRWYHQGISLLEHSCGVGTTIHTHFADELEHHLNHPDEDSCELITQTARFTTEIREKLQQGRDKLLEKNSCRMDIAEELIQHIRKMENAEQLGSYMQHVFNQFGVDQEYHSRHAWVIRPGDHMLAPHFPGLPNDGITVSYDRETALTREDMAFLSWEHPIVEGAMELIQAPDFGNTALATISVNGLKPGTLLVECFFIVSCMAPRSLQLKQFFPVKPIRLLLDDNGRDVAHVLSHDQLNPLCKKVPLATAQAVIKQQHGKIRAIVNNAQTLSEEPLTALKNDASTQMQEQLNGEIERLLCLQKINPQVRDEEIQHLRERLEQSIQYLTQAQLELYALRVIITT